MAPEPTVPLRLSTSPVLSVTVIVMLLPVIDPVMVPVEPQSGGPIKEEISSRVEVMLVPLCTIAILMPPPLARLGT